MEETTMATTASDTPTTTPTNIPIHGLYGTRLERTFIAVKPDGVQRGFIGQIIQRFEAKGLQLVGLKFIQGTKEQVERHYGEHVGRWFFDNLVRVFSNGPIVAMVWQGRNAIATGRFMIGDTKPERSSPGTIRGDLSVLLPLNVIHACDSEKAAQHEIPIWFEPSELSNWHSCISSSIHTDG